MASSVFFPRDVRTLLNERDAIKLDMYSICSIPILSPEFARILSDNTP